MNIFGIIYTHLMRQLESKIGYGIRFAHIPDAWINGLMTFNMEKSWAKQGIRARGINYWTIGSLRDGISSRYLRNEKQYQSWLGAYLVKYKERREFTLQDHFNLAVADQKNWLFDFGDRDRYIKMSQENISQPKDFPISNYNGKLYEFFGGISCSDVGSKSISLRDKILMSLTASMFNRFNPELKLKGPNLLPGLIETEYEKVVLRGYIAVIDLEENTKAVLYGNSAAILNDGKETDYYPLLKEDILGAFKEVEIVKFK